nr:alpha/beta hydrolase [Parvibaculum indicum]
MAAAPLIEIEGFTAPGGAEACWLEATDGARLRAVTWTPEAAHIENCRGTVFLFGGRTEFAEKYFEVIGELIARGFAVATMDWRGQGLSARMLDDPRKGHIDDFATFDRDLGLFMAEIAPAFPKPWIAMSHSMGGNILLRACHDHADWFSGAVFSAPMLGLRLGNAVNAFGAAMLAYGGSALGFVGRYIPGGGPAAADEEAFEDNIVTSDEWHHAVHQALVRADPALGLGAATFGWVRAAIRSIWMTEKEDYLREIRLPVLIAQATKDRLIDGGALEHAAQHIPDAELLRVEGAEHEILMERDALRAVFWQAFDRFAAKLAPRGSLD